MVQMQDVKMIYPGSKFETLSDIDLTINDGEFVFLVGPSGSGKTTIIKLLTGEIRATDGQVIVNGYDMRAIRRHDLPKMRSTLGIIFQDFRLIRDMTIFENVAFAMRVVGQMDNNVIRTRVEEVLDLVGILDCADRYPRELSGGEQQRVAVARALVNSPEMIIADEPTGNLDPAKSLEIMMLLDKINQMGTTVLVVTHEKEMVNAFSKRVVALSNGQISSDYVGGYYNEA